jgi:hypothetical protein
MTLDSALDQGLTMDLDLRGRRAVITIPNRGHSLTIDAGWPDVADAALPS